MSGSRYFVLSVGQFHSGGHDPDPAKYPYAELTHDGQVFTLSQDGDRVGSAWTKHNAKLWVEVGVWLELRRPVFKVLP